jgi:hypothetical protein
LLAYLPYLRPIVVGYDDRILRRVHAAQFLSRCDGASGPSAEPNLTNIQDAADRVFTDVRPIGRGPDLEDADPHATVL